LPRNEEHSHSPRRKKVESGDELGGERWKERPVPADEPNENARHRHVQGVVERRRRPGSENRQENDLQKIGGKGDEPGREDAARVLGGPLRRPRDAGQLLLESLGVQPAQAGQLDSVGKKRALMAAIFLGKAGESELAVQLFMALGEQARAVEVLQRAGASVGAARLSSMKPAAAGLRPGLTISCPTRFAPWWLASKANRAACMFS